LIRRQHQRLDQLPLGIGHDSRTEHASTITAGNAHIRETRPTSCPGTSASSSATKSVLAPGDVASFDTNVPRWFGSTGHEPAEILSIFGRPGERMTVHTLEAYEHRSSRRTLGNNGANAGGVPDTRRCLPRHGRTPASDFAAVGTAPPPLGDAGRPPNRTEIRTTLRSLLTVLSASATIPFSAAASRRIRCKAAGPRCGVPKAVLARRLDVARQTLYDALNRNAHSPPTRSPLSG
jgi:hypothetical protein